MADITGMPSRTAIFWLMSGLTLGALPHFLNQPLWVMGVFICMMVWRLMHQLRSWPLPSKRNKSLRLLHTVLAFSLLLLLIKSYGSTIGRDAGIGLLTAMLGLKVVEMHSRRDFYVTVFLGYFLVITNFLYSQSIPVLALMILVLIIMTVCLISINLSEGMLNQRSRIKLSMQMLLQASPIMLLLFVLFPRVPGPLWGLPEDARTASTGISDDLTMGSFSQLAQSDEIAFRVNFTGAVPPSSQLYWRGPVLSKTDGRHWKQSFGEYQPAKITAQGQAYSYVLTLEPHNKHWLFALDLPNTMPQDVPSRLTSQAVLLSTEPVKKRLQYHLQSNPSYQFDAAEAPKPVYLELNDKLHPQTRELAKKLRAEAGTEQAYITEILNFFHNESFVYTLTPPLLQGDPVDTFLFTTRQGFCEHYAASFTVLMRAAGIPARIVTGYLGGEINPVDNTLIVRQRDAHAWSEVWLADQGWVRIDPTAAVSEQRIELGMTSLLPAERLSPLFMSRSDLMADLWRNMQNNWDALNTAWDLWVLAYGPEKQKELLAKLGMSDPDWQKMAVWLGSTVGLMILLLTAFLLYRRPHPDKVFQLYQQFCRKLARAGVQRQASEGPWDFAKRAQQALPASRVQIQTITQLYAQLRYQSKEEAFKDFAHQVRHFKARR